MATKEMMMQPPCPICLRAIYLLRHTVLKAGP